jgi:hypothetical protein
MTKTDGTDRRSDAFYLTPDGNALLDRADALVQEHEKRLERDGFRFDHILHLRSNWRIRPVRRR